MSDPLQQGNDCYTRGDPAGAIVHYRQALAMYPDSLEVRHNLGVALRDCERWEEAREQFQALLARAPHCPPAHNNLGILAAQAGDYSTAVKHYRQAIAQQFDFPDAHFNLGMLLLKLGEFAEGLAECEWRWQTPRFTPLVCPQPRWDGRFLAGTLLVHTEQGAGDTFQFARYLPEAARRCRRLLLFCPDNLLRLLALVPGVAEIRTVGQILLDAFQAYSPLMSLPHLFGTTLESIPAGVPYLCVPNPWFRLPAVLAAPPGLRVGFTWAGSPTHANDRHRSCHLADLLPLFDLPGVAWYSLQKGPQAAELRTCPMRDRLTDLDVCLRDFADTASAIGQMDLVISVDTAVAHLAGALGKPVWVLLPTSSDWRWLLDRTDSPWYPTMCLFRQRRAGDWAEPVEQMLVALRQWSFHALPRGSTETGPGPVS